MQNIDDYPGAHPLDLLTAQKKRITELEAALTRIANHHGDVPPYNSDEECWDHIANLVLIAKRALEK